MKQINYKTPSNSAAKKRNKCNLLPVFGGIALALAFMSSASANTIGISAGIIDAPVTDVAKGSNNGNGEGNSISTIVALDQQDLIKEVRKEQEELEKVSEKVLKDKADSGERLAQVVLANDFASEAQMLTFAPAAANSALSDAVRLYALAAQRGFPGAASLDTSGVSFYPLRVVRNR